ncbi:hypothetical protein PR048_025371 [Dryococelus australis]|uniref:Reverse transcriptase domain-containing protein n=1 Tax=Dryococelus australis TaxID=614101 RepID=A0ABQ9GR61_9NEOP|nr:hypothetical protein PR048_025371 [Dryococelus australis]
MVFYCGCEEWVLARKVAPEDQEKTAFCAQGKGTGQFKVMPFGLCSAPTTFERLMEKVLPLDIRQVYLDYIVVTGRTFEEHLFRIDSEFHKVATANLKLAPKKCHLFQKKIHFLGHVVSVHGTETDSEKTKSIRNELHMLLQLLLWAFRYLGSLHDQHSSPLYGRRRSSVERTVVAMSSGSSYARVSKTLRLPRTAYTSGCFASTPFRYLSGWPSSVLLRTTSPVSRIREAESQHGRDNSGGIDVTVVSGIMNDFGRYCANFLVITSLGATRGAKKVLGQVCEIIGTLGDGTVTNECSVIIGILYTETHQLDFNKVVILQMKFSKISQELHAPARIRYTRRSVIANDVYSKYVWGIPLKNKTGKQVTNAMNEDRFEREEVQFAPYRQRI